MRSLLRSTLDLFPVAVVPLFSTILVACQPAISATTPDMAQLPKANAMGVGGPVTLTEIELQKPAVLSPVGYCLIFEDLDADGLPDVFFLPATDGNTPVDHGYILHNTGATTGSNTFNQVTIPLRQTAGARSLHLTNGCTAGDYDNDGLPDLFIPSFGDLVLLHNLGKLAFEETTQTAGLTLDKELNGRDATFIDYDLDGRLDLYIVTQNFTSTNLLIFDCVPATADFQCRYETNHAPLGGGSILYRNVDGKTFQLVANAAGAINNANNAFEGGMPNIAAVTDWNLDGRPDLIVGNDFGINRLYQNSAGAMGSGGASFTNIGPTMGFELFNHAMGVATGDFNGDGRWDLYVADLGFNQLWFGNSDGTALNHADAWGVSAATTFDSNWAPAAADFNQDGWLDVLVASSGRTTSYDELGTLAHDSPVTTTAVQGDTLFVNQQDHFAAEFLPHTKFAKPSPNTAALALADLDGDGDLDVAEVYGQSPVLWFRMFRNDTASPGNYLQIKLLGTKVNRDAVGAVAKISVGGNEQMRMVHGKSGSLGKSSDTLHFGLGKAMSADSLHIVWPGGATQDVPGPIAANQVLTVKQN